MKTSELGRYFRPELFLPDLKSNNKLSLLEELVEPLVTHGFVKSKGIILETLSKRETLGSTGIGIGVAIPHCRTLAVSNVHIVVGLSKNGVEFNARDGKPVHLFFLIVAPPVDQANVYLPILGKIVELVRNSKLRQAMMKADSFDSFIKLLERG